MFSTKVKVTELPDREFRADLEISSALPAGQHSVDLELRLCEDEARICNVPVPGSPWLIAVKVNVLSQTNRTPLNVMPNVANWSTYQGNASHSAYVPAVFDTKKFSRRWVMYPSSAGYAATPLTHDDGRAFVSLISTGDYSKAVLMASSEDSGEELWRMDFGPFKLSAPAAADGKVYVATSDCCSTFFWALDQKTGKVLSKHTTMQESLIYNTAPTIFNGTVYSNAGIDRDAGPTYYRATSVTKISTGTLGEVWKASLQVEDEWTPAVDELHAYVYAAGKLHAISTADGKTAFTIPYAYTGVGTDSALALDGSGMAFTVQSREVVAFDLKRRKLAWSTDSMAMTGSPAVARNVVYALRESDPGRVHDVVLEAFDAATGLSQWKSGSLPAGSLYLVAADNLVFVGAEKKTVAIDIATHRTVWEHPGGGQLSISNRGVLYIAGTDGKITAINLR
ncbi:PQQ-binding-like beta-propeller repeat protein [Massilia dura]|uniref:PQQ-binding-like beta-propeller repeat protein n=1 Tax=Pseudoduganella dura TaxID=321982 RepID=A0A6I3XLE3_9BURK|nr:PQQ-binding-like beta-propeller repeat protein [Pseudoduganella dura]